MAWTAPTNVATGDVLSATRYNNEVVGNALAGGPIYATEALRDAAITAPFEGQRAYITGSTETTAVAGASGTTAIPSGIQTIYNGAAWVTVTEVGAYTATAGTIAATAAYVTTLTGDATALSVTLRTGTSALITFSSIATHSVAGQGITNSVSVGGASAVVASVISQASHVFAVAGGSSPIIRSIALTGLVAGVNVFTLNYFCGATTATMTLRSLTVKGIA